MIAIIDYGMGNIRSLGNALDRLGAQWILTPEHNVIREASHVILPGVGNASEAMKRLAENNLPALIQSLRQPVLGICVGMQVMCRHTAEGDCDCMGIFDAKVHRFVASEGVKVPHMGWSKISNLDSKLFRGLPSGSYMYFVHSYYAPLCPDTIATSKHPDMYSAALKYENFYGTQFHPEKSGEAGEKLLQNFISL